MAITRAQIKYDIWLRLQKSPVNPGFYTEDKVNSAVQEALDFVTGESMLADEGFNHKIGYLSPQSGMQAIVIPFDMAMLLEVRYLQANLYMPLAYDQQFGEAKWNNAAGAVQSYPSRYKLIDNQLYFTPPLGVGGENFLEIEFMAYPRRLRKDSDAIPAQFDRSMYWYVVYRACNILIGQLDRPIPQAFQQLENTWYGKALQMINMRTRQVVPIKEFEG